MKDFKDFEKFIHTDGKHLHEEIVSEVNTIVQKADIKDKIEEQVFYYRTFSEISAMKTLKYYHEWLNKNQTD